jgi:hypothetical protein
MLFHYFDRFLADYECRFEKEHGFWTQVAERAILPQFY